MHSERQMGDGMQRAKQSLQESTEAGPWEPLFLTLGTCLLCGIVWCVGAAPHHVPTLYLALAAVGLPWRVWTFCRQRWGFYLIDYCYFANGAVIAYLILGGSPKWQAAVYALSEGPLAAAPIVWQCAWVLDSVSHTTSVLVHLLPGLSMHCMRHLIPPCASGAAAGSTAAICHGSEAESGLAGPRDALTWLLLLPTLLYLMWQLLYWLIVQVCCSSFIQLHGLDTSYRCLTRRHGRANSPLYRLGRPGSVNMRLLIFGVLQLLFTLLSFLVSLATYHSPSLAAAWQVVKFVVPLYYGAQQQAKAQQQALRSCVHKLAAGGLASPVFLQLLDEFGAYVHRKEVPPGVPHPGLGTDGVSEQGPKAAGVRDDTPPRTGLRHSRQRRARE